MLLEKNNRIIHVFIKDKYIPLKENDKITSENYKEYLDENYKVS